MSTPSPTPLTTIVGTNTSTDIQLVQYAINQGGTVFLKGIFNFTGGESTPVGQTDRRIITVGNSVRIVGDELTVIIGGERPFYVNNAQAEVSFEGLRFQSSMGRAIHSKLAKKVEVKGCKFFGIIPVSESVGTPPVTLNFASAIAGTATGTMSIIGNVIELGNEIDSSGSVNSTNGMNIGGPMQSLEISSNDVRKTTAHGIDLRNITGTATIKRNNITTGNIGRGGGRGNFVDGIRCAGKGSYSIVEFNFVEVGFENGAGIRLSGLIDPNASTVTGNVVRVTPLSSKSPGEWSAGIQVQGSCNGTNIEGNNISGRALGGLSVVFSDFQLDKGTGDGKPRNTKLNRNDHTSFIEALADIVIQGAEDTVVTALGFDPGTSAVEAASTAAEDVDADILPEPSDGTIYDQGIGTIIFGNYTSVPVGKP